MAAVFSTSSPKLSGSTFRACTARLWRSAAAQKRMLLCYLPAHCRDDICFQFRRTIGRWMLQKSRGVVWRQTERRVTTKVVPEPPFAVQWCLWILSSTKSWSPLPAPMAISAPLGKICSTSLRLKPRVQDCGRGILSCGSRSWSCDFDLPRARKSFLLLGVWGCLVGWGGGARSGCQEAELFQAYFDGTDGAAVHCCNFGDGLAAGESRAKSPLLFFGPCLTDALW
jgi:hypothetical protein